MSVITYDAKFYVALAEASAVAKEILEVAFQYVRPNSIVDLGTGVGSWPAAAKELGVERVRGVDGNWVPAGQRLISGEEFIAVDLEGPLPDLGQFDMAISVEVLEHISADASIRAVEWLCQSAPIVLFSAAIPFQGGTHHINEAWQSHWAGLFERCGHRPFDLIRPKIWAASNIPVWYRQNILLMVRADAAERLGLGEPSTMLDCVHPDLFLDRVKRIDRLYKRTPKGFLKSLGKGLGLT